jgi:hypothetical protein
MDTWILLAILIAVVGYGQYLSYTTRSAANFIYQLKGALQQKDSTVESLLFETKELRDLALSMNEKLERLSLSLPPDFDTVARNSERQTESLAGLNETLLTISLAVQTMQGRIDSIESFVGSIEDTVVPDRGVPDGRY